MTSREATSLPSENIFSSYCFKEQRIVLPIQRFSIPSKQVRHQGRETSSEGLCCFVWEILESAQILGPGIWTHRMVITETTVLRLVLLPSSCPSARSMSVHTRVKYTVWDWRKAKSGRNHRVGDDFCVSQSVKGCDYLEQSPVYVSTVWFSLCYPLGYISL